MSDVASTASIRGNRVNLYDFEHSGFGILSCAQKKKKNCVDREHVLLAYILKLLLIQCEEYVQSDRVLTILC